MPKNMEAIFLLCASSFMMKGGKKYFAFISCYLLLSSYLPFL